jgi:hypothetical protein
MCVRAGVHDGPFGAGFPQQLAACRGSLQLVFSAYPGGIIDRVVRLSNGAHEVHHIGVNWPHHIFVNQSFQVIGANS